MIQIQLLMAQFTGHIYLYYGDNYIILNGSFARGVRVCSCHEYSCLFFQCVFKWRSGLIAPSGINKVVCLTDYLAVVYSYAHFFLSIIHINYSYFAVQS